MDNRKRSLDFHNPPRIGKNLHKNSALSNSSIEKSTRRKKSRQSSSSQLHNDSDSEEIIDKTADELVIGHRRRSTTYSARSNANLTNCIDNKNKTETSGKQAQNNRRRQRRRGEATSLSEARDSDEEDLDQDRHTLKSAKVRNDSSASGGSRRKKKRKLKARDDPRDELPITEILRKSQETARVQYEESAPLPQLTADTIYVQGRNGFSAIKISDGQGRRDSGPRGTETPIKVAIFAQKAWRNGGLIYQGLLAGMALMHFIFMLTLVNLFDDNIVDGSIVSEIYASLFSFLIAMSVVSAFDKFDLAHLDWEHFKEIYINHAKPFLAIPLYITVFCLHQTTSKFDDNLALVHYQARNESFFNELQGNSTMKITNDDLSTWKCLVLIKDGLAVLAWLFIALGPQNDMLLVHLKALQKYAYDLDGI